MALLNYTTTVAVEKTVGEIQRMLAKSSARSIQTDYDAEGEPVALAFQVEVRGALVGYRLPANIEVVHKTLLQQYNQGKVQRRFVTREQAARVGWRILKDWTEAQVALLETRMVSLDELLLPWMIAGQNGETLYQLFESSQLALPGGSAIP